MAIVGAIFLFAGFLSLCQYMDDLTSEKWLIIGALLAVLGIVFLAMSV